MRGAEGSREWGETAGRTFPTSGEMSMNTPSADSRVVMVTGGTGGIGRTVAEAMADRGMAVGLVSRSADRLEEVTRQIRDRGGMAEGFAADVLDPAGLDRALRQFEAWSGGRCDGLVCAAGRLRAIGPVGLVDLEEWLKDAATSLEGTIRAIRGVLGRLRQSAAPWIAVMVGPGLNGELANGSGYAASQAGLVRLVESLDAEFRPDGPRVYAVNPGIVETGLMNRILSTEEGRRWLPRFTEAFAEGKEVTASLAAEMICWLAEHRPIELSGRVVPAMSAPEFLETRLGRIVEGDLNRLRLR